MEGQPPGAGRHRWRQLDKETMRDKEEMLITQSHFVVGGLMLIALAVTGVVFLIFDVLFSTLAAGFASGVLIAAYMWFWYGLPLSRRGGGGSEPAVPDAGQIT